MMSCSIIDDLGIVEGGRPNQRPNQIVGPDYDHGQAGNARTGPRAWGIDAPPAAVRRVSGSHGDLGGRWREEPRSATSPNSTGCRAEAPVISRAYPVQEPRFDPNLDSSVPSTITVRWGC